MTTFKTNDGRIIKVVSPTEIDTSLTAEDVDMDNRAKEAVRVAIEKAKFLKKPIGRYDSETKRAYLEYPNGERRYVN